MAAIISGDMPVPRIGIFFLAAMFSLSLTLCAVASGVPAQLR